MCIINYELRFKRRVVVSSFVSLSLILVFFNAEGNRRRTIVLPLPNKYQPVDDRIYAILGVKRFYYPTTIR